MQHKTCSFDEIWPMTGCSVSPTNMRLAHLASTNFPFDPPEAVAEDAVASSEARLSDKRMPPGCSRQAAIWRLSALCWRQVSSRVCGGAPFRDVGAVTVPRVRRYHQMGAAVGWLQRHSGRSAEGQVS